MDDLPEAFNVIKDSNQVNLQIHISLAIMALRNHRVSYLCVRVGVARARQAVCGHDQAGRRVRCKPTTGLVWSAVKFSRRLSNCCLFLDRACMCVKTRNQKWCQFRSGETSKGSPSIEGSSPAATRTSGGIAGREKRTR